MLQPAQSAAPGVISTARLTALLGLLAAFNPFATDMYLAGFPAMARDLATTPAHIQFTLSIYFFGTAAGQLLYGPLADRYGRRGPMLVGIALFTLTACAAIFAPTVQSLIALRLLQAIGACAGMIIGRAIIRDLFQEVEAARVLSVMMALQGIGPVLAPVLGGFLLLFASWRLCFLVLTVLGSVCFITTLRWLPETLPPAKRTRGSLRELLAGLSHLLRRRDFMVPTLAGSAAQACVFAFITGSPTVFMQLHGVNPQQYGLLFGLSTCGILIGAQVSRLLLKRWSPRQIYPWALHANLLSVLLLLAAAQQALFVFTVPLLLCLTTVPSISASSTAVAMSASGRAAGSASSLFGLLQFGFAAVASSLVGALHDGSALPMVGVMLAASVLGNLVCLARGRAVHAAPENVCHSSAHNSPTPGMPE